MRRTLSSNLPQTWRMDLIAVTLMASVTGGALVALQPVLSRSADESHAVKQLVGERRATSELSRSLAQKQAELRSVKRTLEGFSQPCWTNTDKTQRMGALYTTAREAGLQQVGLEPGTPEVTSGRRAIPLRLVGRGTYAAIATMYSNVRSSAPDMVVRSIEMTPAVNTDSDVMLATEILWVLPAEPTEASASTK